MERFSFYRLLTILALRQASLPLDRHLELDQGSIQGVELTSVQDNSAYIGFLGIPYAKPPVGHLRFKAPLPPGPWNGTLYATRHGAQCIQMSPFSFHPAISGSEDCLFLNVYTPKLPTSPDTDLLPVMVWFHGGSFEYGSGDRTTYGPDHFIVQGVLVVTVNYRLGPLGFLSFEDSTVPGNAGMKDQVAALRWVQKNIARFGGDPNQVTIFGQSAGSASVQYHMISPMSRGLFHRAISQSGTALHPWSFTTSARAKAIRFAEILGCDSNVTAQVVECLRNVSGYDIVHFSHNNMTDEEERHGLLIPFLPSSEEGIVSDEEVFLPGHPDALMSAGEFQRVPHILGVTSHEAIFLGRILSDTAIATINTDHEILMPPDLLVQEEQKQKVADKIKQFYFGNKNVSKATMGSLVDVLTDVWFTRDVRRAVHIEVNASSEPIYLYQFSFNGKLGFMKQLMSGGKLPGACHADDLGYLFTLSFWKRNLPPDSPEMITVHRMVKMWTNFAKTGNPSSELDALLNVTWTPATTSKEAYLSIDTELSMRENIEEKRMAFWDDLYRETQWLP